nr:hypothetical protein [Streptomyces sp. 14R-10]
MSAMTEPEETSYWVCEATFADGTTWTGTFTAPPMATSEDLRPEVLAKIERDHPNLRGMECSTWLATRVPAETYRAVLAEQLHLRVYGPPRHRWPFTARLGVPLFLLGLALVLLGPLLPWFEQTAGWGVSLFTLGVVATLYATHIHGRWWQRP